MQNMLLFSSSASVVIGALAMVLTLDQPSRLLQEINFVGGLLVSITGLLVLTIALHM